MCGFFYQATKDSPGQSNSWLWLPGFWKRDNLDLFLISSTEMCIRPGDWWISFPWNCFKLANIKCLFLDMCFLGPNLIICILWNTLLSVSNLSWFWFFKRRKYQGFSEQKVRTLFCCLNCILCNVCVLKY